MHLDHPQNPSTNYKARKKNHYKFHLFLCFNLVTKVLNTKKLIFNNHLPKPIYAKKIKSKGVILNQLPSGAKHEGNANRFCNDDRARMFGCISARTLVVFP
jgi:hypothetical protein